MPVPSIFLDSLAVLICRALLFYVCYKHVLSTLYHDLRSLSTSTKDDAAADAEAEDVELSTMPHPSTSTAKNPKGAPDGAHGLLSHLSIARVSFSLCFSESCTMFLLFLCQEIGLLGPRGRYVNWRISLFVLLVVVLVSIPLSQNILLTYHSPLGSLSRTRSMPTRVSMALIPYAFYLFLLAMIPLPESLASETVVSAALARLVVLGTFIIGMLSGIGAARYIWEYLPAVRGAKRRTPTAYELTSAEDALQRVRNDLVKRRGEEARLMGAKTTDSSSWISRVSSTLTGNSELTSLQREIEGLVALEYQMDRNLEEMRKLVTASKYHETLGGRIIRISGSVFALYCVFRSISCIFNLLAPLRTVQSPDGTQRRSYTDLIAHFLTYLVSLLPFIHLGPDRISAIARQLSLALVGVIIASSVRFVLRAVSRFLRITSRNLGASLLLLILAQLMGTYLVSTLVQLRTAFPLSKETFEGSDAYNVLATLPAYEVFGSAFDLSYLLSALVTGGYLWFDDRINRSASFDA